MDKQISSDISEGIKNLLKEVCDVEVRLIRQFYVFMFDCRT